MREQCREEDLTAIVEYHENVRYNNRRVVPIGWGDQFLELVNTTRCDDEAQSPGKLAQDILELLNMFGYRRSFRING